MRTVLTFPAHEYILEDMPMNGPVMPVAQAARGKVLVGARAGDFVLESIELGLESDPIRLKHILRF